MKVRPHPLPWIYLALVFAAATWAIANELSGASGASLLPPVALYVVTLPTSQSVTLWPFTISGAPLFQVGWATACGLLQALGLFWLAGLGGKGRLGTGRT